MALNLSQTQRASQKQLQKMGQLQIQALKYLSLNSLDLRNEIYNEVEKNPALEISSDSLEDFDYSYSKPTEELNEYTTREKISGLAEQRSQDYQEMLENNADDSETLIDHLISQFNILNLPQNQKVLGEKLINNLDQNGFHILAPVSFLNYETDTEQDLLTCLDIIQKLEPCGCCCQNIEESLYIQARNNNGASQLSLFILNGHLEFLDPPQCLKVLKKILDFAKEEKAKAFNTTDYSFLDIIDEEDVEDSITFIQSLNPHPACEYSTKKNSFVVPDVRVEKINRVKNDLEFEDNIVSSDKADGHSFVVISERGLIPELTISSDYQQIATMKDLPSEQKASVEKSIQDAKNFIESLLYREDSVFTAAVTIVRSQLDFFEKGPGHLKSLRQKDVAEILGVHETTVSRMANSKYLQCEWGLFPFKYFFVGGISQSAQKVSEEEKNENPEKISGSKIAAKSENGGGENSPISENVEISKDRIIFEMKKILDSQPPEAKKLSDQKLSDMLAERGIKVARRTVAKYRTQIGVRSSYDR